MNRKVDVSVLNIGLAIVLLVVAAGFLLFDGNTLVGLSLLPIALANITIALASRSARSRGDSAAHPGDQS